MSRNRLLLFLAVSMVASMLSGLLLATFIVATTHATLQPQPPFPEPTPVELDATAGLLPPSPNG